MFIKLLNHYKGEV